MQSQLQLGEISIDVVLKDIKNIHLSVYPPTGRVRISAPVGTKTDALRAYAISRLAWIKKHQKQFCEQEREAPRDYIERESHYVWGKRYLLTVEETGGATGVDLTHRALILRVRPGTPRHKRAEILSRWYRDRIRAEIDGMMPRWEKRLGVSVNRVFVQKMATQWGSCNPAARNIRLNTELGKKPLRCLEYILVHEMVHLIEPNHGERFRKLMDRHMPQWRERRDELNRAPLGDVNWTY